MSELIFQKLKNIIHNIKPGYDIEAIKNTEEKLDLDSLDMMTLYFDIEKDFNLNISEEDISTYDLTNLERITEFIKKSCN